MLLEQKYLYPVSGVCTASVIQLDHIRRYGGSYTAVHSTVQQSVYVEN